MTFCGNNFRSHNCHANGSSKVDLKNLNGFDSVIDFYSKFGKVKRNLGIDLLIHSNEIEAN